MIGDAVVPKEGKFSQGSLERVLVQLLIHHLPSQMNCRYWLFLRA